MAHIFEITASPEKTVTLDTNGVGSVSFTVTNVGAAAAKARAVLSGDHSSVAQWLKLVGETERLIQPKMSDTFVVKVNVPPGTKPGDYSFRLDAVSVASPDEDSTQGPTLAVPVTLAPAPPKPFPWWIIAVAVVVIGIASYAALKLIPDGKVDVPKITAMNLADGAVELAKVKLKLGKVENLLTDQLTNVDVILKQDPAPSANGSGRVAPDSEINVQVGIALVPIPNLKGPLEAAQQALKEARLEVGEITRINQAGAIPGTVLDYMPSQGKLESHSKVNLTVQTGEVDVPDLSGQILQSAQAILAVNNLRVGAIRGNPFVLTGPFGGPIVPRPLSNWSPRGQKVAVGSTVDLIFSDGPITWNPRVVMSLPSSSVSKSVVK